MNRSRTIERSLRIRMAAVVGLLAGTASMPRLAAADSQVWQGPSGNTWGDAASWVGVAVPGFSDGTPNLDIATFDVNGVGTVDLGGLTWTAGGVAITNPAGGYTFGNGTLDINTITLSNALGANAFSTPITDQGDNGLVIDSIAAGGQTAGTTLTLNGLTITSTADAVAGSTTATLNRAALNFVSSNGQSLQGITAAAGTYTVAGGVYFNTGNAVPASILNGTWTVGGTFLVDNTVNTVELAAGSTFSITGNLHAANAGGGIRINSTGVTVGGDLVVGVLSPGGGNTGGATLTINQALAGLTGTLRVGGGNVVVNASNPFTSTAKVIEIAPAAAPSQSSSFLISTAAVTLDNAINVGSGPGTTTLGANLGSGGTVATYNGAITLGKSVNLNQQGSATAVVNFAGPISGAGASVTINTVGGGIVQLGSGNTFGGIGSSVTLNNGLVRVAADGAFGDAANSLNFNGGGIQFNGTSFDITAGRTLVFNNAKTLVVDTNGVATTTFANAFGGGTTAAFTKTGAGTLILGGANTFSGQFTLTGGTVQTAVATNAFGMGAGISVTNAAGSVINLRSNTSATFGSAAAYTVTSNQSFTINVANNGSGSNNTLSLGAITIGNNAMTVSNANGYTLSVGVISQSSNGTTTITNTAPITIAGLNGGASGTPKFTFNSTGVATITGNITQGAVPMILEKSSAAGTVILQGTSNMTGGVIISNGTIQTAVATNALGSTSGISVGGSGVFAIRGDATATFGNGTNGYTFITTAGNATLNGEQASAAAPGTVLSIGNVTLGGNHLFRTTGTGTVGLGVGTVSSAATAPGTLGVTNNITNTAALTIAAISFPAITQTSNVTLNGSGNTIVTGAISQNGSNVLNVIYSGTGTLTLRGDSSYTGDTSLSNAAAILALDGNTNVLGLGTGGSSGNLVFVNSGAQLVALNGAKTLNNGVRAQTGMIINGTNNITFNGAFLNNATGASIQAINNPTTTFNGGVVIRGDGSTGGRNLTFGGSGNTVVSSVISNGTGNDGTTNSALVYAGTGSLTLSGVNTYQGQTTITQGTVYAAGNALAGQAGVFGNPLTVGASTIAVGSNSLTGAISILTTGAFQIDRPISQTLTAKTSLTIGGNHTAGTSTYTGAIGLQKTTSLVAGTGGQVDFTGTIGAGTNSLIIGSATLGGNVRLGNTATTTSGVNVNFGKLTVDGGIAGGGAAGLTGVNVAAGATLAGNGGTITKAVTVAGTLAPGSANPIGTLGIVGLETGTPVSPGTATLNFTGGATLVADLTSAANDQVNVTGNIDLGGATLTVLPSALLLGENQFFTLISNDLDDAVLNTFGNYAQGAAVLSQDGFDLRISYVGEGLSASGGNDVVLYTEAIPEPASVSLITLAAAGLLARRCRRSI